MANHVTELIEIKELNDEQVAFKYRCCGEEMTDSWVTVNTSADLTAELKAHQERVQDKHEKKIQHRAMHASLKVKDTTGSNYIYEGTPKAH